MDNSNVISIETANKMLPLVAPITEEMKEAWEQMVGNAKRLEKIFSAEDEQPEKLGEVAQLMKRATKTISKNLDELESLGCIVESFKNGVVDFPSEIDGEEVMLCWKLGEDEVSHHHKRGESIRHRLLINQVLE